ncbi:MAG: FG-GAP repeat domain-containing protein, partial [Planctomycetota bacterium]
MNILRKRIKAMNLVGRRDCWRNFGYYLAMASVLLCAFADTYAKSPIILNDVTKETGITFVHTDGGCSQRYIMETVSAGLALFDYDGDGYTDIYFLNGAPLKGTKGNTVPRNKLYRNQGGWRFADVTENAHVGNNGYGLGVAVGDYDNDGDQDIYLNNYGPNVLYRNNSNGTFTDITKQAGVANGFKVGAGACFLDMDKDGDLDLYVSNYLDFSYEKHVSTSTRGYPVYANPRFYLPLPDVL